MFCITIYMKWKVKLEKFINLRRRKENKIMRVVDVKDEIGGMK